MPLDNSHNEPPTLPGRGLVRLRCNLAYDGTNFAGWAFQPNLRTVQSLVQNALGVVLRLGESVDVVVAGRTDAGVHARGQVIHADVPERAVFDFHKMTYAMNGVLPADVRINSIAIAPHGFDARFAAIGRRYSYAIADRVSDPLTRGFVVNHWRTLDEAAMNAASADLIGLHDFTSFCKQTEYGTSIRILQQFEWRREPFGVVAHLRADAFCHSMVRSLIGCLVPIGEGRRPIEFAREVLQRRARGGDVVTMPGHGLVLEEVYYPADTELLDRQLLTRAKRDASEVER
jgi:tRNA pseudouridine38-40 synthase